MPAAPDRLVLPALLDPLDPEVSLDLLAKTESTVNPVILVQEVQ